jgi:hypothetical protein
MVLLLLAAFYIQVLEQDKALENAFFAASAALNKPDTSPLLQRK